MAFDLCNITFACPMFGNKALKQYMANQEKQFHKMYHFVKEGDIVPGNLNLDLTYCKDYYIDGQNTQLIFFEKMSTGGGKRAPSNFNQGIDFLYYDLL